MYVLSIDPGETTGWAYQDGRDDYPGGILDLGQVSNALIGMVEFLEKWDLQKRPVDALVIEDYRAYDAKANMGSKIQTIGVKDYCRAWGHLKKIPTIMYESRDIDTIAKQVGMNPRKGAHENTHWAFAANYGRHYLVRTGNAKSAIRLAQEKKHG